jgi:hypothetical protein
MKSTVFYRIASVLLAIFAVLHTIGFRQTDPTWIVDALLRSMQSIHFAVQGFSRSYWDFFVGFGLFVTVFLLFAAILAWQLSRLPAESLVRMSGIAWAFAICFAAITVLTWGFFFIAPLVISILITACLVAAAWLLPHAQRH